MGSSLGKQSSFSFGITAVFFYFHFKIANKLKPDYFNLFVFSSLHYQFIKFPRPARFVSFVFNRFISFFLIPTLLSL